MFLKTLHCATQYYQVQFKVCRNQGWNCVAKRSRNNCSEATSKLICCSLLYRRLVIIGTQNTSRHIRLHFHFTVISKSPLQGKRCNLLFTPFRLMSLCQMGVNSTLGSRQKFIYLFFKSTNLSNIINTGGRISSLCIRNIKITCKGYQFFFLL